MKRKILVVGAVLAILGLSVGLMFFFAEQKKKEKKKNKVTAKRYVKTRPVAYRQIPTELEFYGRLRADIPLDVVAEVPGKIQAGKVPLKAGQSFRKGTLLFTINATEARLKLRAAKSAFLKEIAAILPDLKIDFPESYPAWQTYFDSVGIHKPLPDLPDYRNTKEKTFLATKNIYHTYYTLKSSEEVLKRYRFYAPFSGSITEVFAPTAAFANPGVKVIKILKTSTLELEVAVNPQDIRWVKPGTLVAIRAEDGRQIRKGKVVRIGEVLNPKSQALKVFIRLLPGKEKLYQGMYLKASVPGTQIESAMEIPRAALVNKKQVYTIENDSILAIKTVKVHKLNTETAIISGLQTKESLIVESVVGAYEGMKIFGLEAK